MIPGEDEVGTTGNSRLEALQYENLQLATALKWEERFRDYRDHLEKLVRRGLLGIGLGGGVAIIVGLMSIYDQLSTIIQERMREEFGTSAVESLLDDAAREETNYYLRAMEDDGRLAAMIKSNNPEDLRCAINMLARQQFMTDCTNNGGVIRSDMICSYFDRRDAPLWLPFPELDCMGWQR